MTNEIVQSDIDLTRRMLELRRSDRDIIAILGKRGIDTDRAALLIDDLRYGRNVVPHLPLGYHIVPRGPMADDATAWEDAGAPATSPGPLVSTAAPAQRSLTETENHFGLAVSSPPISPEPQITGETGAEPRLISASKWTAVVLVLITLGVTAWILRSRVGEMPPAAEPVRPTRGQNDAPANAPAAPESPGGLNMELGEEGLLLSGARLQRSNALALLVARLGAATRTNTISDEQGKLSAYAFDAAGLIVYSADGTEADSLVLDFSGGDSPIRSQQPFAGAFRIMGKSIGPRATPRDLLALRALNLEPAKEGLMQGRIARLELAFMTSAGGLDCLVIDFK